MSRNATLTLAVLSLAGCLAASVPTTKVQAAGVDPAATEEANLRSITFIDADRGWATGERGTILHTGDGGVTWSSQPSPTTATLSDVAMYNSQRGLAIGGSYHAHTQLSVGEVVITKDGGESWVAVANHDLPRLRKLLIGPGGKCVAVGDWSPVQSTSVFTSADGGQNWQPRACDIAGALVGIAGSVDDFVVLSDRGEVVRFQSDAIPQLIFPGEGQWHTLSGHQGERLLVGSRGAIRSYDHGTTWQVITAAGAGSQGFAAGEPVAATMAEGDIWLAKDSSSSIVTIRDESVRAVPRPGDASLRALMRLDRDRGWAVGDFGLILATRDGGQSWRTLRGGDRLPAVLFVAAGGDALPWSLMAQESFQHQRRIALAIDREHDRGSAVGQELLSDAAQSLGPATIRWTGNDAQRIRDLLASLRPPVVILDASLSPGQRESWTAAAIRGGSQRVLEVNPQGTQTVHVAAAIPAVGILASDVWCSAISRLAPGSRPPSKLMLRPLFDATRDTSVGDGLAACTRNDRRYGWSRTSSATRRQLQILQARTAELTWVESLVGSAKSSDEFAQLLGPALMRMSDEDRERMLSNLFALTAGQNRHDLYVATLERSLQRPDKAAAAGDREPSHLLRVAELRLRSLRASSEWRHTFGSALTPMPAGERRDSEPAAIDLAVQWSPFQSPDVPLSQPAVQQASGTAPIDSLSRASQVQLAGAVLPAPQTTIPASKQSAVDLRWEFHPAVLTVRRAVESLAPSPEPGGDTEPLTQDSPSTAALPSPLGAGPPKSAGSTAPLTAASNHLGRLLDREAAGRWAVLAADRLGPQAIACPVATTQPYLDGNFDEPWWLNGQTFGDGPNETTVRMAHDDEFVYLAIDAVRLEPSPHNKEIR
ncbi:MAG: YCF48-related protein, partial [Planctomycetaceae bacterium]